MYLIALSSLVACNNIEDESSDSPAPAGSSYSWGSGGSSGSDDEESDPVDTASDDTATTGGSDSGSTDDEDTETDSGTTETGDVTAKIWVMPAATWDPSVTAYDSYPEVCLYDVANVTDGDWEAVEYSVNCAATTEQNEWIYATKTFTPGDILSVNADWWNGQIDVYFAGANGVVSSGATYLIVQFEDNSYDGYYIEGDVDEAGEAGWVENGDGTGGNVYIYTLDHTVGDYE